MPTAIEDDLELTRNEIGMGVYALADLRHLLAVSDPEERPEHVAYWLRAALNPVPHRPWQADYSFSDLVSLLVVRELLRKGVRLHRIKEAESWMRDDLGIDRPLVRDDIKTDGVEVFYRDEIVAGQIEAASRRGQQTMREPIKDRLTSVHYNDGRAAAWTPARGVVVNPRLQFGAPVVEGTGIPTSAVSGVAGSLGINEAINRFKLPPKLVKHAIAFEQSIASLN